MKNYDFLLNERGDISFETIIRATSESLLFNFYAEINDTLERQPEWLQFNFNTYEALYDKNSKIISGDEYIKQAIRIRLETEKGTLRENLDLGSNIHSYRHMFINPENVISKIEACVYEAIKDIVPNSEIKVLLEKTTYYDFFNSIKISITFENKIMYFTL